MPPTPEISNFIDFSGFGPIFLKIICFIYEKWVGNTAGRYRIYLEVVSDLNSVPKSQSWVLKLNLHFFGKHDFPLFVKQLLFES